MSYNILEEIEKLSQKLGHNKASNAKEVEDFLDENEKAEISGEEGGKEIDKIRNKILDFANIKIPAIDPHLEKDIKKCLSKIDDNLQKLKLLVSNL